jgi:pyroglutamyl-peptidase
MIRILLTGFEPFDHDTINPSAAAVEALAAAPPPGGDLATLILPTTYGGALPALRRAIARHRPDVVLSVGQAGGRAGGRRCRSSGSPSTSTTRGSPTMRAFAASTNR